MHNSAVVAPYPDLMEARPGAWEPYHIPRLLKLIPKLTLATLPHPHIQSAPNLALVHPGLVRYSQTIENRIQSHTWGQKKL